MLTFARAIERVLAAEGGYVNDPADAGGETRWGVTARVARGAGYHGAMADLPRRVAVDIYRARYWRPVGAEDLVALGLEALAEELFDTAVNCGVSRAGGWLQRGLNALNDRGRLYCDVAVDGVVGPATLAAARALVLRRGDRAADRLLTTVVNSFQCVHYVALSERRQTDERFVYGWLMQRVAGEEV